MSADAGAARRLPSDGAAAPGVEAGGRPGSWLVGRRCRPDARLRLYCFAHSGGSPGEYLSWREDLPGVEVLGVRLPGRAGRLAEAPMTNLREVAATVARAVPFDPPFALFGHSLGALVAFETARALRAAGCGGPEVLIVSAQRPPHLPHPEPLPYDADDATLAGIIGADSGPLPAELLEDTELLRSLLAAYRADLLLAARYAFEPKPPLDCPIVAVGGIADSRTEAELAQWRRHTVAGFQLRMLPGDHFYLRQHSSALLRVIRTALATRPSPTCPGIARPTIGG